MSFTPNKICYIMKKTTYTTLKRMSCPKASVNLCGWRGAHETWSAECKLVSDFQIKSWRWGHFKFTCKLVKVRINVVIWKGLKMTTKCFRYFFQEMETRLYALECGLALPLALLNRMWWKWLCSISEPKPQKAFSFSFNALETLNLPWEKSQARPCCKRGPEDSQQLQQDCDRPTWSTQAHVS